MKMKAVCDATGLTDRTVRYYIDENLISPLYSENYLGRKTFDFSEADIQQLRDIAVLRKFGFSIAEIKEMIRDPECIIQMSRGLQERKQSLIDAETELLQALLRLDSKDTYTVATLAAYLSAPVSDTPIPAEDSQRHFFRYLLAGAKCFLIGIITWSPVVLSLRSLIDTIRDYHYPIFNPRAFFVTILSLIPSFLTILLPRISAAPKWKATAKKILLILCVFSIPIGVGCSFGVGFYSETTDFGDYRDLDPGCIANRSDLFQDLFPKWPHYFVNEQQPDGSFETVYLDAHYYYHYVRGWDYTYDIYAEWPLEQEAFSKEVERAKKVFDIYAPSADDRTEFRNYLTIQKGSYTCLMLYNGEPPFEEVTTSYTYCIFAYDTQNLRVRYIYCDSLEDGIDQPYYLSLEW